MLPNPPTGPLEGYEEYHEKLIKTAAAVLGVLPGQYPICARPWAQRELLTKVFGDGQEFLCSSDTSDFVIQCEPFDVHNTKTVVNMRGTDSKQSRWKAVTCHFATDLQHGTMIFLGDDANLDKPIDPGPIVTPLQSMGFAPPTPTARKTYTGPHFVLALDEDGHAWCENGTSVLPLTHLKPAR